MSDKKISELPAADTPAGSELMLVTQDSASKKLTLSALKAFVLAALGSDSVSEGSANLYFTAARVRATVLDGLSTASASVVTAADTALQAFGKLQAQINNISALFGAYKPVLVFAHSAVAATAAADTNENVLATITVPAGVMGVDGQLRITTLWSHTSSANTKTLRVRFGGIGGATYLAYGATTSVASQAQNTVRNRNSTSSQIGYASASTSSFTSTASAVTTSTVDTTAETTIVITGQKASGAETITLESYLVELIK